jgi:hypothetical protein
MMEKFNQPQEEPQDKRDATPEPASGGNGKHNGAIPTNGEPTFGSGYDPYSEINFTGSDNEELSEDPPTITIGKPDDETFFRVSPDPRHFTTAWIFETDNPDGFGKQIHLLVPTVAGWAKKQPSLMKKVKPVYLYLVATQEGDWHVWPIVRDTNPWHTSQKSIAEKGKTMWVRMYNGGSSWKAQEAVSWDDVPNFPTDDMKAILRDAFGLVYLIQTKEHEVFNKLLGLEK